MTSVRQSYDALAKEYAEHFFHELDDKPLDRALLDVLAAELRGQGPVVDLGCGPGHAARYLHERGVDAAGLDLSPTMIALARELSPGLRFEAGSMLSLPFGTEALSGAIALYAIVNLEPTEVAQAFAEAHRTLKAGAPLFLSFHVGEERHHVSELFGISVDLDFYFYSRAVIEGALTNAGFEIEAWLERRPYAKEHPSTRAYVLARRGGARPTGS